MRRIFWLVLVLAACDQKKDAPPPAPPTPQTPAAALAAAGMTEEQFAALHTLRADEPVKLDGKDVLVGGARAYLSLPANAAPGMPAVIVVHEWWGLNDHIRHYADRLAQTGIAALAVDLYGGNVASTREQAQTYMKNVDPKVATETLKAAAEYLKNEPTIRARRRGVIGFCFGGRWSLETALAVPDLDAAVVYYGFVPTDEESLKPLKAPLLAFFGTKDESIPAATVDAFEATLRKLGKTATIERMDAGHAFANPSGDHYDSAAAKAAWTETRAFLNGKLGAN